MFAPTFLSAMVVATMAIGCASRPNVVATEISGTPSPTGCDAWFEIGGTFSRQNELRFTLENRSSGGRCIANRVQLLFQSKIQTQGVRVSAPAGWRSREVSCTFGGGWCGYEWFAVGEGVRAGLKLSGFGATYVPSDQPLLRSWIVDLGRRRVEMLIGTVGGVSVFR
jgi:hypothetical protein